MGKKKNCEPGLSVPPVLPKDNLKRPRLTILQADVPGDSIGEQLKTVRLEFGYSVKSVSQAIGEKVRVVFQTEKNEINKPEVIKKLSELYNLRVGIFLKRLGLEIRPLIK